MGTEDVNNGEFLLETAECAYARFSGSSGKYAVIDSTIPSLSSIHM